MAQHSQEFVPPEPLFDPSNPIPSVTNMFPPYAKRLEGINLGATLSGRLGEGSETIDERPYQVGDDPAMIDWIITAGDPNGWPTVRVQTEEINPSLYIVTDAIQTKSESGEGYFSHSKLSASVVMALAKVAQRQGLPNTVVVAADSRIAESQRRSSGQRHFMRTANWLGDIMTSQRQQLSEKIAGPEKETLSDKVSLQELLDYTARIAFKSAVVVVSDFRDTLDPSEWQDSLAHIRRKGNELTTIELRQPADMTLPSGVRKYWLGGRQLADISGKQDRKLRDEYGRIAKIQEAKITEALQVSADHHLELTTADPLWLTSLNNELKRITR